MRGNCLRLVADSPDVLDMDEHGLDITKLKPEGILTCTVTLPLFTDSSNSQVETFEFCEVIGTWSNSLAKRSACVRCSVLLWMWNILVIGSHGLDMAEECMGLEWICCGPKVLIF